MPRVTRRRALQSMLAVAGAGAPLIADSSAGPRPDAAAGPPPVHERDPTEVIRIWPGSPPGGPNVTVQEEIVERPNAAGLRDRIVRGITEPRITVFRAHGPPRGAFLMLPGGGYRHVVIDKEGFETARWLAARGISVFVLFYRLPSEGWGAGPDAPLQDAQRAMRLLRSRAATWAISPQRLGVIGFSAGGHLAARLACSHALVTYPVVDEIDEMSARPDNAGLIYPVVAMDAPDAHAGSREYLLGPEPSEARVRTYSADTTVPGDAPPTFILHAEDDASVPVQNALRMRRALREAGVPVDLHVFSSGGHGFGLRSIAGKPVAIWPQLFLDWADWRFNRTGGIAPHDI